MDLPTSRAFPCRLVHRSYDTVAFLRVSSPYTAAGPCRNLTGFPSKAQRSRPRPMNIRRHSSFILPGPSVSTEKREGGRGGGDGNRDGGRGISSWRGAEGLFWPRLPYCSDVAAELYFFFSQPVDGSSETEVLPPASKIRRAPRTIKNRPAQK